MTVNASLAIPISAAPHMNWRQQSCDELRADVTESDDPIFRGRPDYYDPSGRFRGRATGIQCADATLVPAIFGVMGCAAGATLLAVVDAPIPLVIVLGVFGAVAGVDIIVVITQAPR